MITGNDVHAVTLIERPRLPHELHLFREVGVRSPTFDVLPVRIEKSALFQMTGPVTPVPNCELLPGRLPHAVESKASREVVESREIESVPRRGTPLPRQNQCNFPIAAVRYPAR